MSVAPRQPPHEALALRRQALVRRSDELRVQIRGEARTGLRTPLAVGGALWSGLRWVRAHPWIPLAATAVVLAGRQRRWVGLVWRWGGRGLSAFRLLRRWVA